MKKIILAAISAVALLAASCSNDEITVVKDDKVNDVNVTVSLNNFFSSYNFNDTQHDDIQVSEQFRVFNSENGFYIQVRTLFFDSNGELADSIVVYSTNTNAVVETVKLAEGTYTAVSTLLFAYKSNDEYHTVWTLKGKESLSSATLVCNNLWSQFSIMSYDAKSVTVRKGQTAEVVLAPSPVGALAYLYFQNFQYSSPYSGSGEGDNGIRTLAIYGRNVATGYRLNPNALERFVYMDDAGADYWYYLSNAIVPQNFDESWTYFKGNLYDYFLILAPQAHIQFGYIRAGEDIFNGYGEAHYTITSGQMYLAYWDYFAIGNPYFGRADNNHWNTYSVKAEVPLRMPRKAENLK